MNKLGKNPTILGKYLIYFENTYLRILSDHKSIDNSQEIYFKIDELYVFNDLSRE